MEGEHSKRVSSVPSNFLTLAQLQERWLQRKQREKEAEEEEARLQKQKEEEERNRREKEDQQRRLRIQQTRMMQNENREKPRSNNVPPRPPFHRNRRNQCPAGDNELKLENTHAGEFTAEEAELKSDVSIKIRRGGWKKREPIYINRQNRCPNGGGAGDDELKPEETHIGESRTEVAEPKIDGFKYRRTGWKNRKPLDRNRQNQCPPGGGAGDEELMAEETHTGDSVAEIAEPKIDESMYSRTGWKNRKPLCINRQNQSPGGSAGDDELKAEEGHNGESVAEVAEPKIGVSVYRRTGWKNRKPLDGNRQNQSPGGSAGDDELKPEEGHNGESVAEVAEPKIDVSVYRRTGWKNRKPLDRNRQIQLPGGGSGDNEVKPEETHTGEVVPEDVELKIDDSIKKTRPKKRGRPRVRKKDRIDDLLPEIGANKEVGKGRLGEKKVWVDVSRELERKFEKISLCGGGGGGGEGFNGRRLRYMRGGGGGDDYHHQNYRTDCEGFDEWRRKRNPNLVWVKKGN